VTSALETFTLSLTEIDILAEHLQFGRSMFPIEVPSVGATDTERHAIAAEVWQALAGRGLVYRRRLEPEVEDALRVLTRPIRAVSAAAVLDDDRPLRVRGASNGRAAVVADLVGDGVRIDFVPPNAMLPTVVDRIGVSRPGPGRPFTVPGSGPGPSGSRYMEAFDPVGDARRDADEEVWRKPRLRAGAFTAHTIDRRGHPRHSPELDWFDTARGRYAVHASVGRGGHRQLTCAPADNVTIAHYVRRLLDDLVAEP
jgi:EspG family